VGFEPTTYGLKVQTRIANNLVGSGVVELADGARCGVELPLTVHKESSGRTERRTVSSHDFSLIADEASNGFRALLSDWLTPLTTSCTLLANLGEAITEPAVATMCRESAQRLGAVPRGVVCLTRRLPGATKNLQTGMPASAAERPATRDVVSIVSYIY
jgi:hypothetical protein